ncbi:serine proteinase inhibitor, partial [Opisthorchis viverrini]
MGEVQVYQSVSAFSSNIYGQVFDAQSPAPLQNVLVSPISMYIALLMTLFGTGSNTRGELQDVLQLPRTLPDYEILKAGSSLVNDISRSTDVTVLVANRLFLLNSVRLNSEFQSALTTYFSADVEMVCTFHSDVYRNKTLANFVSSLGIQEAKNKQVGFRANARVDTATHSKWRINPQQCSEHCLWKHPFDKRNTHLSTFYTPDGRGISVRMMYANQKFDYLEMEDIEADAIKLPFGDGSTWDMLIILPYEKKGLRQLLVRLQKKGTLSSILSRTFQPTTLQLYMPRFRIGHSQSSVNMKQALINLGARSLFSDMADFSGISYYDFLSVSSIFHKAVLVVNEDGAEAAAATSVNVFSRSAGLEMRVDRPFFVAIVHRRAGPVFLGHVVRPGT